nr:hypothetical protein JVH1_4245 [Rhodococcus sp. JVH1]
MQRHAFGQRFDPKQQVTTFAGSLRRSTDGVINVVHGNRDVGTVLIAGAEARQGFTVRTAIARRNDLGRRHQGSRSNSVTTIRRSSSTK